MATPSASEGLIESDVQTAGAVAAEPVVQANGGALPRIDLDAHTGTVGGEEAGIGERIPFGGDGAGTGHAIALFPADAPVLDSLAPLTRSARAF